MDDATFERYRKMPGAYGRYLRFHLWKSQGMNVIQKQLGRCPHLNCDRMCQFQVNGEPELMPLICRVYPRDAVDSDMGCEVTMELSCISMAKTFLENTGRLSFVPTELRVESTWEMDNSDPGFYYYLKEDREKILDHLWGGRRDLAEVWQTLYAYVYKEHDLIVRDRLDEAKEVSISEDEDDMGMYHLDRKPTYAFFGIQTIDRMILNQINYGNLKLREREFYKLIMGYKKLFSDKYVKEADRYFDDMVRKMMDAGYRDKYVSYFSYNIQQLYIKAYETYHILRQYLFAVLYVQLLMMFDLVDFVARKESMAPIERQAEILMLCEQGIRHNPSLTRNLLEIIREEFL